MRDMRAKGAYTVKKWEEKTYEQISSETKMTHVSAEFGFNGEIVGTGSVEYLMFYSHFDAVDQHKASASYVGLIRFDGALAGRSGSFVLEDNGTFEGGAANSSLRIAQGSGTGSLAGIKGTGMYRADREGCRIELNYGLP